MRALRRLPTCLLALAASGAGLAAPLAAQSPIPEKFTNLEVLPKAIPRAELVETMKGFTAALGVRCEHCHATKPGADPASGRLEDLDFASDAREPKQTARAMLRMVAAINGEHLAKLPGDAKLAVTCATCHRGVARPEPIEAIVERELGEHGVESALARYRELRQRHYGSAAYDFSATPLARLGERLLERRATAEAVAVLRLGAELHPDAWRVAVALGEAELAAGDREAARNAFARAVELEPRDARSRQKLAELAAAAPPP